MSRRGQAPAGGSSGENPRCLPTRSASLNCTFGIRAARHGLVRRFSRAWVRHAAMMRSITLSPSPDSSISDMAWRPRVRLPHSEMMASRHSSGRAENGTRIPASCVARRIMSAPWASSIRLTCSRPMPCCPSLKATRRNRSAPARVCGRSGRSLEALKTFSVFPWNRFGAHSPCARNGSPFSMPGAVTMTLPSSIPPPDS